MEENLCGSLNHLSRAVFASIKIKTFKKQPSLVELFCAIIAKYEAWSS